MMKKFTIITSVIVMLSFDCWAQENDMPSEITPPPTEVSDAMVSEDNGKKLGREFAGLSFSVGISFTHDLGDHSRIEEATIDENGVVRVKEEENDIARIMLESHYFFAPKGKFFGIDQLENTLAETKYGWGPFISLQPGTDEIIEAIGAGFMLGFKKCRGEDEYSSWNIGLGVVVDPNVRILGDGIKENKPLPEGESQIRYKKTSQMGILLIASFSW